MGLRSGGISRALFDSNIVIDLLKGHPDALAELGRYETVAISVVTWIEVMAGAEHGGEEPLRATLAGYRQIDLTAEIAERAAAIRRARRIKLPDAIIQASAEAEGLVTRNERDFPAEMPGVRLPYRP